MTSTSKAPFKPKPQRKAKPRKLVLSSEADGYRITTEDTNRFIVVGDFQCHQPEVMARMVRLYNRWVERELERLSAAAKGALEG